MTGETVRKTVLKNGLRVVSETLPGRDSVTIGVWVEVGSRHEEPDNAGISHFLEHMVFKGTENHSSKELASAIERLGGSLNAFTSREHTCFHARVLHRDLPTAVDIIAELATRAKIPAAEVKKERHVVAEEIKDAYDTPHEWVHELFTGQIWPGHALGRPIAGTIPAVMGMTRPQLQRHIRRFYRPENMVVAAGGNLSHDRLVRLVRRAFKVAPAPGPHPVRLPPNGAPVQRGIAERDINQTHVCIGFPTWRFADKRRHTTLVAGNLLGGGMSSRLFQTVREKRGLVYAIYTFHDAFHDAGFFGVYFACDPKQVIRASNLVLQELGRLVRTPVGQKELGDVKSQLHGNLLMGLESTPPRTHRLARHELYLGDYVPPGETWKCINRVSARDLNGFAREAFSPDRLAVAILGPVSASIINELDLDALRPAQRRARSR